MSSCIPAMSVGSRAAICRLMLWFKTRRRVSFTAFSRSCNVSVWTVVLNRAAASLCCSGSG